jgi:hypothetical protein
VIVASQHEIHSLHVFGESQIDVVTQMR